MIFSSYNNNLLINLFNINYMLYCRSIDLYNTKRDSLVVELRTSNPLMVVRFHLALIAYNIRSDKIVYKNLKLLKKNSIILNNGKQSVNKNLKIIIKLIYIKIFININLYNFKYKHIKIIYNFLKFN